MSVRRILLSRFFAGRPALRPFYQGFLRLNIGPWSNREDKRSFSAACQLAFFTIRRDAKRFNVAGDAGKRGKVADITPEKESIGSVKRVNTD
jgi:hypothetical protein